MSNETMGAMTKELCRCPPRPYMQSWASGSAHETASLDRWEREHGGHAFAKARDILTKALQVAEGEVRSGEAALDMVSDIFGLVRGSWRKPITSASEAANG